MTKKYKLDTSSFHEEYIMEAKGWFPEAKVEYAGKTYLLTFYDPYCLAKEIDRELSNKHSMFIEKNIVVIIKVNTKNIKMAIEKMVKTNSFSLLLPEE